MELYLNKEKTTRLKTDNLCAWIEEYVPTNKKNTHATNDFIWKNVTGYYGRLDQCLSNLVNVNALTADVKTLEELREAIARIEEKIDEAIPILQKNFTDKRVGRK